VREYAAQLVDGMLDKREFDFMAEFAQPFPSSVFLRLVGLDAGPGPRDQLCAWASAILHTTTTGAQHGDVEAQTAARLLAGQYLAEREPLPAYYRDRDARIGKMDEQDVQRSWLLPSLGMGIEEGLQYDVPAAAVAFKAFNRSLLEDWGYNYLDRIYTAPYLAFGDVDAAVAEVEHGLANGARLFVVRPGAVYTEDGWLSPGNPRFDPIWARLAEAGVPLIPHVAEVGGAGLEKYTEHRAGSASRPGCWPRSTSGWIGRPSSTWPTAISWACS